jgi:hypothetical protein
MNENARVQSPDGPGWFKSPLFMDGSLYALVALAADAQPQHAAQVWKPSNGKPGIWVLAAYPLDQVVQA